MRNHPRPFVVEVKRGTSRQSFQSHSSESDKFSAAERLLFSKTQPGPVATAAVPQTKPGQSGRVLPVLADGHDIVLAADPFPAPRRGRPPGSKNKVKPIVEALSREASRPVFDTALNIAKVETETTKVDDRYDAPPLREHEIVLTPAVVETPIVSTNQPIRTTRLRDRSRILRRYVLGTEPRAGERKSFRKRKSASSQVKRDG